MSAWSVDALGNDDACDWTYGLEDVDDLSLVAGALDEVLGVGSEYLEAPQACEALAAIEAIARVQGNWGERTPYSEAIDEWVERVKLAPPADLALKAHKVIDRILGPDSELRELWEETEEFEAWKASVAELKSRVKP